MRVATTTLTLALALSATSLAAAGGPARVPKARIVVADLVPDCPESTCDIEVARSPLPGRTSIVTRAEVVRALEAAGLDAASMAIPKSTRVFRPSRRPSPDELDLAVEQAIQAKLPEHVKITDTGKVPLAEVPVSGYEVQVRWPTGGTVGGRVSIPVELLSDGEVFAKWQISAKVEFETRLPVLISDLPAGSVLRDEDVEVRALTQRNMGENFASDVSLVVGHRLRRDTPRGEPLALTDLEAVDVVRRGENVMLESVHGAIRITASAVAREDGALGERIRVVAGNSQRLLWARITAPGRAVVTP